jgi:nucleotide-binding universal stress UspA family protein
LPEREGQVFKTVVVGTDGSETADRAVQVAADLARTWGSELHVVSAYRSDFLGMAAASGAPIVDAGAWQGMEEGAVAICSKAADTWGSGVRVETHAVPTSAPDAILDVARSLGADLVVVGSKGMKGARRVLGSVPNSVAHGATCAVLVVKTD